MFWNLFPQGMSVHEISIYYRVLDFFFGYVLYAAQVDCEPHEDSIVVLTISNPNTMSEKYFISIKFKNDTN